tara:strand:- start:435 stop:1145 length:711 start_codon:yes stop_codon:yes gene_type:complete
MKLRCPYCKETFTPQASNTCPACGKMMRVPTSLKPRSQIRKHTSTPSGGRSTAQDQRAPTMDLYTMRAPVAILTILLVMASLGALLSRTSRPRLPTDTGGRIRRAQAEVNVLRIALQHFHRDCNTYPLTRDGLMSLVKDEGYWGWEGPYVTLIRPDPWSQRYAYAYTNGVVYVYSSGPDARPGTADDILPGEEPAPDPTKDPTNQLDEAAAGIPSVTDPSGRDAPATPAPIASSPH